MRTKLATAYLRWTCTRAALARGYWLVAALYLVVVARLTPVELILIGVFQGITVLIAEVPAGVLADVVSRRLSLVVGHVVMGAGMAMAGLVTAFPLLVASQCLWGLGWAFSSGADVAWITDELDRPDLIDRLLVSQARWDLFGTAIGIVSFALLAQVTTLSTAIVSAGVSMMSLGVAVVARWPEVAFTHAAPGARWSQSRSTLRGGLTLARRDRAILVVIVATLLVNGSAEAYGRLREKQLLAFGVPAHLDAIVWLAALGLVGVALGAGVLRIVEARINDARVAPRTYVFSCAVGVVGMLLFAHAADAATAVAGFLLLTGITFPVSRTAGVVWVNRRTVSAVRATVHSLLSQAEQAGEIIFGALLAVVASAASITVALTCSAMLFACAGLLVARATRSENGDIE